MHSSRMRTVRCSGHLPGGGGVCPGGVSSGGGACHTPPMNRITDRLKASPCRNYVADGNNDLEGLYRNMYFAPDMRKKTVAGGHMSSMT